MHLSLLSFLSLVFGCSGIVGARRNVPGPGFPPLNKPRAAAIIALQTKLDSAIADLVYEKQQAGDGAVESSSFAVQVTSATESLWSAYHTGDVALDTGSSSVGGDTIFRIASISKTFTVYALLLEESINLNDPVTEYIPELLDREGKDGLIDWSRTTIRSLASQLSGIPRDTGGPCFIYRDIIDMKEILDPVGLGLPPVSSLDRQRQMICRASDILDNAKRAKKVCEPDHLSTYSNMAFSLLGIVLERATNRTYEDLVRCTIFEPLQLCHTSTTGPPSSDSIIRATENDFFTNLGADAPTAGLYSSADDLSKYIRSILSSTLLPSHITNDWMQPHSWTNRGSSRAYGMPWEILRTTKLTRDERPLDIVSKAGALKGYHSTLALIPELGIGFSVLVAGEEEAMIALRERVTTALIPAIDDMVREAARDTHAGRYALTTNDRIDIDWRLSLEVDEEGPGLRIAEWISNGTDFLKTYGYLQGVQTDQWEARLLPSGVRMYQDTVEIWRIAITQDDDGPEGSVWSDASWTDIDDLQWADKSIGEFWISLRNDGRAVGIQMVGLRMELSRLECSSYLVSNVDDHYQAYLGYLK